MTDKTRACVENRIGAGGAQAVAEALMVNQTVTQINLMREFRSDGAEVTREWTDVARACVDNLMGDESARALAEALKVN